MDQRVRARGLAPALPRAEAAEDHRAGRDHERSQREAEGLDRRVERPQPAPVAGLQHSDDDQREAHRREHAAHPVQLRLGALTVRLRQQPRAQQDRDRDEYLADEHHPPAQLGGGPAAEDGADCDPGAGDAAQHAVGDRPVGTLVVAGDERNERRQHERRADPLQDRPAQHQGGDAPRRGGQAGAGRVDAHPNHERAPPAEDVSELAAGQHQRGHRQRVERDHRLDRGDGRVEVLDQLGDGHVHHRLIQDHQELRSAQHRQDTPLTHAAILVGAPRSGVALGPSPANARPPSRRARACP